MNDIARTMNPQSRPLVYPEGAVIVREKLKTEAGAPELLTAMIKRKKGFNPEANDWEFLLVSGDGTKIKERETTLTCLSCHTTVSVKDFVFKNYVPVSEPEVLQLGVRKPLSKQTNPFALF